MAYFLIDSFLFAQKHRLKLNEALRLHLKVMPEQIKTLESGGVIAYLVDTGHVEDILLIGAARIWATQLSSSSNIMTSSGLKQAQEFWGRGNRLK